VSVAHFDTWAIYGQAAGETEMTDWRMVSRAEGDQPGKVEMVRTRSGFSIGRLLSPEELQSTPIGMVW